MAPGESLDLTQEWRVDKLQADQMCKELCCGIMAILEELKDYKSMVLRMIKAGNSGCWINQENGYASIVHMNR